MIAVWLAALSLVSSAAQEPATPWEIPVLEGATASPDCNGYTDETYALFCVTTADSDARSVAARYVEWFRAQGFEVAAAPEADAGFFRAPCDYGLLNVTRVIDEQYRMTRVFVFRIAPPTLCDAGPAEQVSPDEEPTGDQSAR